MTSHDRDLQRALVALASERSDDALWASAALIAAASVTLGEAIGEHAAGEAILDTVRSVVARARH